MQVRSLDQEDPLEKGMATHSCIIAWRIPLTEEPGGLQSMGSHRVGHDWLLSFSWVLEGPAQKCHFYHNISRINIVNVTYHCWYWPWSYSWDTLSLPSSILCYLEGSQNEQIRDSCFPFLQYIYIPFLYLHTYIIWSSSSREICLFSHIYLLI